MTYEVIITSRAEQEAQAKSRLVDRKPLVEQAARWYDEFLKAAFSLEANPDRFPLAAENESHDAEATAVRVDRWPDRDRIHCEPPALTVLNVAVSCPSVYPYDYAFSSDQRSPRIGYPFAEARPPR